jgi:hypothetical protein
MEELNSSIGQKNIGQQDLLIDGEDTSRRDVLRALVACGAAVAAGMLATGEAAAEMVVPVSGKLGKRGRRTVYRLRTRNTRSCNACKLHHRYKIFTSKKAANLNRAHPGCNCPIVKQKIAVTRFKELFPGRAAIRAGVVDLRQIG